MGVTGSVSRLPARRAVSLRCERATASSSRRTSQHRFPPPFRLIKMADPATVHTAAAEDNDIKVGLMLFRQLEFCSLGDVGALIKEFSDNLKARSEAITPRVDLQQCVGWFCAFARARARVCVCVFLGIRPLCPLA